MSAHAQPDGGRRDEPRSVRLTIPAKPEYITLVPARPDRARAAAAAARRDARRPEARASPRRARTPSGTRTSDGEGTVEIVYELDADRLVVEVADDGQGFDARTTRRRTRRPRARAGSASRSSRRSPTSSRSASGPTAAARGSASSSFSALADRRYLREPPRTRHAPARQRRTQVARGLRDDRDARADGRDPPARRAARRASASSTSRRRRSAAASPRSTTRSSR